MRHLFLAILYFILFSAVAVAQDQENIDSLKNIAKSGADDTNKVNCLRTLCFYYKSSDTTLSFKYGREGIELAKKLGFEKGLSVSYNNIGTTYAIAGNYTEAIKYFELAISHSQKIGDKYNIASANNNLGIIYLNQGNYQRSLNSFLKAMKLYENLDNTYQIDRCLNNIGSLYYYTHDIDLSLKYYFKSLKLKEEIEDDLGRASALCNIAIIYNEQGRYDSALYYHKVALDIRIESKHKRGIANSYGNIGGLNIAMENYQEAKDNFLNSLRIYKEIGNLDDLGHLYNNLGVVYNRLGKYTLALDYHKKALAEAEKNNMLDWKKQAHSGLSKIYYKIGNYKEAYLSHVIYKNLADSLLNKDNIQKITQMEMQHNFEQQNRRDSLKREEQKIIEQIKIDKEKAVKNEELKRQKVYTFSGIIVVLLLLGITFVLIKRNKEKQRTNAVITAQKLEVETQKLLVEEKNKDIMDSIAYAKRIQSAILPPGKIVKEYLKDSFILYKPKDIVAGDFYWIEHKDDKILFAAADCTGHGVPGAMVSVVCNNGLNRAVREHGLTDPGKILDKTRDIIIQEFEKSEEEVKDGMDIALCSLEFPSPKERDGRVRLQYAGAHNPLWIIRNGEILETKSDRQPIGVSRISKPFTTHTIELQKGDTLYIFSDGYVDQFGGEKAKKFKSKAFKKLLLSIQNKSMEDQRLLLDENFESWRGKLEQIDDVCIIGVKI